uniref:Uncharacterized protein n=1 Tax=Aegilops tauschii subsp. strangulata TaxID=200361 RepID=A0A453HXD3_AEGTS
CSRARPDEVPGAPRDHPHAAAALPTSLMLLCLRPISAAPPSISCCFSSSIPKTVAAPHPHVLAAPLSSIMLLLPPRSASFLLLHFLPAASPSSFTCCDLSLSHIFAAAPAEPSTLLLLLLLHKTAAAPFLPMPLLLLFPRP